MKLQDEHKEVGEEVLKIEKQISELQLHINESKSSTLHKLCHEGNMAKIKAYVDHIGNIMVLEKILANKKGFFGYTPLHEAAAYGKHEVLKYLLDLTAKADVNCWTGSAGYTPLHLAASNGHDKCVRELLAHGGDIRCVDEHGKTPKQSAEFIFRYSNTI